MGLVKLSDLERDPALGVAMARSAYDAWHRAMHAAYPDGRYDMACSWDQLEQPERNAWIIAVCKAALGASDAVLIAVHGLEAREKTRI